MYNIYYDIYILYNMYVYIYIICQYIYIYIYMYRYILENLKTIAIMYFVYFVLLIYVLKMHSEFEI